MSDGETWETMREWRGVIGGEVDGLGDGFNADSGSRTTPSSGLFVPFQFCGCVHEWNYHDENKMMNQ